MEKWGYVRVSVDKSVQAAGWAEQIERLNDMGCSKFYYEEESTRNHRPVFEKMQSEAIHRARKHGPVLLCSAKLDRAFRDLAAADAAINEMPDLNVFWYLPDVSEKPLDPSDAGQMLLMRLLGSVAQFERDRLAERRAIGIAKAKADGRYKGRAPTAQRKAPDVLAFYERGFKPEEISKQVGVSRASVYRILSAHKDALGA